MNIDWSKAPEGTTHRAGGGAWIKRQRDQWYQWTETKPGYWFTIGEHNLYQPVQARYTEWTGEGLPLVGAICEIRAHKLNEWHEAKIAFASRNVVVWDWVGEPSINGLCTAYAHAIEIRPIRTPEQIAEEERLAELNEMIRNVKDHPGGRHGVCHLTQLRIQEEACIDLYDAGWRKQVTP